MANPLDIIRMLASQVKRVNPSAMSRAEVTDWRKLAREQYLPMQRKLWEQQAKMEERAANTYNDTRQAEHLKNADDLGYHADRFGKMAAASDNIANAAPMKLVGGESIDPNLRASYLPGPTKSPGGIITYQLPQHLPEDSLLDAATYVELLGADPRVKGAGRVLLRDAGMTSPSNPLTLHSVSDPRTMDFYESRGMGLIPHELQQRSSGLSSTLPAYRIDRGDMLKEAKGGLVQMAEGGALTQAEASTQIKEGALDALKRAASVVPEGMMDWGRQLKDLPKELWDLVRTPADMLLGPPGGVQDSGETSMQARPAAHGADNYPAGSPEARALNMISFANPAFLGNPVRMVKAVPAALRHGAQKFMQASSPAYVVTKNKLERAGFSADRIKALEEGRIDSKSKTLDEYMRKALPTEHQKVDVLPDELPNGMAQGGPVHPDPKPGTETTTIGTRGRAPQNMQEWYDIFEKETA